jgi:NAD(P)-dependent dehydrogenase (short-subunit alcohol dehydrogenase family)
MNKVALITGANKGIGLETARQLGQLGMTVLTGARSAEKAEAAAALLRSEGLQADALTIDVADTASTEAAATAVEARYGKLDVLINNAGIALDFGVSSLAVAEETIRQTFETNFYGPFRVTRAFLPLLRKADGGARVVNLTSILGSIGLASDPGHPEYNTFKGMAYQTSKAALNMLTVAMGNELKAEGIKVNAAHPGWVKTEMGGEGALLEIPMGAKTSVRLATLDDDGPVCGYFHLDKRLPW